MPENHINLTIIPATPGFSVLYLHEGMDPNDIDLFQLHPVIAWRVGTYAGKGRSAGGEIWSDAEPITPAGEVANDYMIVRPDGCIEYPHNGTYESVADAIADYNKDRWG